MNDAELRLLANVNYVNALDRQVLQRYARQLGVNQRGRFEHIVTRVLSEAGRRLEAPEDLQDWTFAEADNNGPAYEHDSLGARLKRSISGSIKSLRSSRSSVMKVDDISAEQGVRLVSPRLRAMPSNDSILRDLAGDEPPSLPSIRPLSPPAFQFGSPVQKQATGDDFAKATDAILKELEARTGSRINRPKESGPSKPANVKKGAQKQGQQAALGVRYEAAHQKAFDKWDSISKHPSVRRHASAKGIHALAADEEAPPLPSLPNTNGKRAASTTSLQSLVGPAAKRLRVASDALVLPTAADARIVNALKEEGWGGLPLTEEEKAVAVRQEERRQQRLAERKQAIKGRTSPQKEGGSPAKRFFDKTTQSLRAFGAPTGSSKPLPPVPLVGIPREPFLTQATAARAAAHSTRVISGPSRIPMPAGHRTVSAASVSKPKAALYAIGENDAASLRSVSGATLKLREQPSWPRIDRGQIQARVQAHKQETHASIKSPLLGVEDRNSPSKKLSSPDKSPAKPRSSLQRKRMDF